MSREVLFKAKRKNNGEWVEGGFFKEPYTDKTFIIGWNSTGMGFNEFIEVNPETVCQYTGLTDKNGKEIWENDVITISAYSYDEPEDDYTGIVIYSEYCAGWCLKDINHDCMILPICDCAGSYITENHYIGNIFDNPELLEV